MFYFIIAVFLDITVICVLSFCSFHREKYFSFLQFVCKIKLISKMLDRIRQLLELFSLVKLYEMLCRPVCLYTYNSSLKVRNIIKRILCPKKFLNQTNHYLRTLLLLLSLSLYLVGVLPLPSSVQIGDSESRKILLD